jgi:hypothetical protein
VANMKRSSSRWQRASHQYKAKTGCLFHPEVRLSIRRHDLRWAQRRL